MRCFSYQVKALCIALLKGRRANSRSHEVRPHRLRIPSGAVNFIFLVVGIAVPALAQPLPLRQYQFEEGSGTVVNNTGTVAGGMGTVLLGTVMPAGQQFSKDTPDGIGSNFSLALTGDHDLVRIPDDFDYTVDGKPGSKPLSQLTIEAWIKPSVVGGGLRRPIWDDYGNPGVFLGLWDDMVQFSISTSKDPNVGASIYSGKVVAGVWQHIAAVYDGTQLMIYVDGRDTGARVVTSGPIQNFSPVDPAKAFITIGAENSGLRINYDGLIDDLRVLPAALTRDQLAGGFFTYRNTAIGIPYVLNDRGALSLTSSGVSADVRVGYGRVEPSGNQPAPVGIGIFGLRQNGVLVTESAVQASGLIRSGRIPVFIGGPLNTGIAIANPFTQDATIDYYFTDQSGVPLKTGSVLIPAYSQVARFLTEAPFRSGSPVQGTFTFTSSGPVAAVTLRGLLNERGEFLITTLPVVEIAATGTDPVVVPHFADGDGWTTEILLVNPSDTACAGTIQFYDQGSQAGPGRPISLSVDGTTGASFDYSIPGRSATRLRTSSSGASPAGIGSKMKVGSVLVKPDTGSSAPTVLVILSHNDGGITVTEAAVSSGRAATALRMFAASEGMFGSSGSLQSGLALFNPSSDPISVSMELISLSGASTGLSASMDLPGLGQRAMFLNQIPGFTGLPSSFQGQLRISTNTPSGLVVTGLAGRFNERGDFLITTTAAVDETSAPSRAELFFPQIADGGGYTTQFILLSGLPDQIHAGRFRFFSSSGQPLDLDFP